MRISRRQIPKRQDGGINPIYVTDPNDPRYIAYQDSLMATKLSNMDIKITTDQGASKDPIHYSLAGYREFNPTGNIEPYRGIQPSGMDVYKNPSGAWHGIPVYQYPKQPIVVKDKEKYISPPPPRDQVNISQLPPVSINQLSAQRPLPEIKVENGFWQDGRLVQDWKGVPNLQIVSAKSKKTGQLEPIAIRNSTGDQIDYNKYKDKPLPKGFQYAQHFKHGGKMQKINPLDILRTYNLGGGMYIHPSGQIISVMQQGGAPPPDQGQMQQMQDQGQEASDQGGQDQQGQQPDVPQEVQQAFAQEYPNVQPTWDVEGKNYEASFQQDGKKASATYDKKGHKKAFEISIDPTELPSAVATYLQNKYPQEQLAEAAKITDDKNVITYEAEVGGKDLIFNDKGKFQKTSAMKYGGKVNEYQEGGNALFDKNKRAFVDSVIAQNLDKNWVQRLLAPNSPSIPTPTGFGPKGDHSTHLMSDNGKGYVFPMIVDIGDGTLRFLPTEDAAYEYAKATNTGIQLPPKEGSWFAANGYKQGTEVLKHQFGGLGLNLPAGFSDAVKNINWNDFNSVANVGTQFGGQGFKDALSQDNPNLIGQQFIGNLSQNYENQNNPQLTQDQIFQQANDAAKKTSFLGINKGRQRRANEKLLNAQNTATGFTNNALAGLDTIQAGLGAQQGNQLLDIFSMLGNFQDGGNMMSKLGYSDGSPFSDMPHIVIQGGIIDMSKTGRDLKLVPDVGKAKIAKAYSGIHKFPKATKIMEIPIQPKMKKDGKKSYYQEGGQGAVGAQLEVGELFATPKADIMDTAALLKHKDMKKDKVTDILGPGDYVFSAMDKMKITKKEADDISFGMGGMLYKEGEIADMPVESLASDIFKQGETEVNLADYVKRVRDQYKVSNEDDVFTKKTNAANKESRVPFLAAAAYINEKKRGGNAQQGFASTFENKFKGVPSSVALTGSNEDSYAAQPQNASQPPTKQLGGLGIALNAIPFVGGMIQGFGQLGSNRNNYRDTLNTLRQDRTDINNLANTQAGYSGLSTVAGLAGIVGQNPTVQAPNYDTTQLDASIRRTPHNVFDFAASKLMAASKPFLDQLFQNSGTFSGAVNAYSPTGAANAGAIANIGNQQVTRDIALENQYRQAKQKYADAQMLGDTNALNQTRSNSNQLIAGAAGQLQSGIGQQGDIQSNRINALRNNNFQKTQSTIDWRAGKNQAWQNIIGTASKGVASLTDNNVFGDPNTIKAPPIPAANTTSYYTPPSPLQLAPAWQTPYQLPPYNFGIPQNGPTYPSYDNVPAGYHYDANGQLVPG